MRTRVAPVWCAVALAIGAVGAGSSPAAAATHVNRASWHKAILEASARAPASITTLSCASPGNCLAGGYFTDRAGRHEAFTVSERNGTWGAPTELRGIVAVAAPNGYSSITAAACGSAENCVVGGIYPNRFGYDAPFVAREVAGKWQPASRVFRITPTFDSQVTSASCGSAGYCLVGGYRTRSTGTGSTSRHAFVLAEVRGAWRPIMDVPGIDALSTADFSETTAITCVSAGTCTVGGLYATSPGPGYAAAIQDFVVSETRGVWSKPVTLTGITDGSTVTSLSCSSAGNCAAALGQGELLGYVSLGPAVATERNSSWGPAMSVPGTLQNSKFGTGATSVSCAANGVCVIGGGYWNGTGIQSFVASEVGGRWHAAITFPRIVKLDRGRVAQVTSVACASAGNCVAGGDYLDESNDPHAFLISQTHGRWGSPLPVPGLPVFSTVFPSGAQISAVACPAVGKCVAAGTYARRVQEGFVVSQR